MIHHLILTAIPREEVHCTLLTRGSNNVIECHVIGLRESYGRDYLRLTERTTELEDLVAMGYLLESQNIKRHGHGP